MLKVHTKSSIKHDDAGGMFKYASANGLPAATQPSLG